VHEVPSLDFLCFVTWLFRARFVHRFASESKPCLSFDFYDSLLDLVAKTTGELSDLQPRAGSTVKVQSFI
jgi:hypothetical protein